MLYDSVHVLDRELALGVAPLAVIGVLGTICIGAPCHVGDAEGCAAALTGIFIRQFEQERDGHIERGGDELAHVYAGLGLTPLPAAHCLTGDEKLFRQFFLRDTLLLAEPRIP